MTQCKLEIHVRMMMEMLALIAGFCLIAIPVAILHKWVMFSTFPHTTTIPIPPIQSVTSFNDPRPMFNIQSGMDGNGSYPIIVDVRERDCLAANIFHEARNQVEYGQILVGVVTMVRVRKSTWPDRVCDVVYEPAQFSWTELDKQQVRDNIHEHRAWFKSLILAQRILAGEFDSMIASLPIDHFHANYVHPNWANVYRRVIQVQNVSFYASNLR